LKPTGTFILNIKEKAVDGERHTYFIDLIGWHWTEEYRLTAKNRLKDVVQLGFAISKQKQVL